jgi:hypothetical protein
MSPTFHVQLFPTTFPPISNDLEAEKRSFHRQRSTRRLEAARGATPLFLDLDSKREIIINSPASPRTRAVRRKGQLFNSPTSPISSTESGGHLFVNTQVQSDLQLHSPSSSCSLSAGNPVTNGNSNRGISARVKAAKTTETEGPQRLAQPFLLQLRSLPVPLNIKPSNPDVTDNSPTSSCFNMHSTTTTTTTTISSRPPHVLTANEKRRKLAKLSRTLGENIPPELVFHSSTTTPTTPTAPLQQTTSVLDSKSRWKSHKLSRSLLLAIPTSKTSIPLSAVPGRAVAAPITPQIQSTMEPGTRVEHKRTTRPRSMTTVPSPTMATPLTRGTSLDRLTIPPFQEIIATVVPETTQEWAYRRKEKDWSGEWNVKDMKHVANALRGLKAR